MLDGQQGSARLRVHAHAARRAVEVGQGGVEQLNEHGPDVVSDPLLEHVNHEGAVLRCGYGTMGDERAVLNVQRTPEHAVPPTVVGDRQALRRGPFDDRDELDEVRTELVAQERVDVAAVVAVGRVDRGQDVPLDAVCLEDVEAADHPVVGGLSSLVDSVPVVELPGPVDGDSDQELVLRQELPPLVVEESAVRLQGISDRLARLGIGGLQFHGEPEEVESHHRGLPALPRHDDLGSARLALDELADVGLEQVSGHAEPATGVEHLLG